MRIQSPLSNLSDVLTKIKESAMRYQTTLKKNEAATRAVLIDPVLRSLGWDTANTYMVEVEKTLDQSRVDYALYDNNSTVRVIIEAKPLGTNLAQSNFIMSLVNYAFTFQLQDIFLTDGIIWEHFTNFQPGNIKVEKRLDIANDDPVECAAYLVQRLDAAKFWPEEQSIDKLAHQISQLESIIATLQQDIIRLKSDINVNVDKVIKPIEPELKQLYNGTYVNLDDLIDITGKRPKFFKLPDGTELNVKRWKDVLRESCKFALAHNDHIPIPLPDRSGKKISLLSTFKPAMGISYITEEYLGKTIFIYVNYDANNCVSNAIHILKQVPQGKLKVKAAVAIVEDSEANSS